MNCKHCLAGNCIIIISLIYIFNTLIAYGDTHKTEIIAHRGFWTATPEHTENSRAALEAALDAGFYGAETDVRITKDDVLVINHDAVFQGFEIAKSTYGEIEDKKLSNGETLPTLDEFLSILRNRPESHTKLILEIKDDGNVLVAVEKIIEMVSSFGLEDRIEYISFSYGVCKKIKELCPESIVYYLSGMGKEPQQLKADGIFLDYTLNVWNLNPSWIDEAHLLNLKTNVWTLDNSSQIYDFINKGIDYITTNRPDVATEIRNEFYKTSRIEYDNIEYRSNNIVRYYDLYGRQIKNPQKGQIMVQINDEGKSQLLIY